MFNQETSWNLTLLNILGHIVNTYLSNSHTFVKGYIFCNNKGNSTSVDIWLNVFSVLSTSFVFLGCVLSSPVHSRSSKLPACFCCWKINTSLQFHPLVTSPRLAAGLRAAWVWLDESFSLNLLHPRGGILTVLIHCQSSYTGLESGPVWF